MKNLTIDCETELIGQGRKAPLMACMSISDGTASDIYDPDQGCDVISAWISHQTGWLIGHNIAFDLAVIIRHRPALAAPIWRLYDQGRVWDTGLHERLYALYHGWTQHPEIGRPIISQGVSLAQLARGLLNIDLSDQKLDPKSPRYQYGSLIDTPVDQWSHEAREYAIEDARITHQIFEAQQARLASVEHFERDLNGATYRYLASFDLQVRAAWALHHLELWGLRTSAESVSTWQATMTTERADIERELTDFGLLRDGKRVMSAIKAVIEASYGDSTPRTEKGAIQTSNEVLEDSGAPVLIELAKWMRLDKLRGTFGPVIESAKERPLNARWNTLVRSGRTSCTRPNLQQLPQEGGIRECFRPREGCVYVGADYSTAELVALAQVCLNLGFKSEMAQAISEGRDLHLALAADLAGVSYEEAQELKKAKDPQILKLRKLAKVPNFGLPGGLSAQGLVGFAKSSYKIPLSEREAEDLKKAWFSRWPEMRRYFDHVKAQLDKGYIIQHFSGRRRGGVGFTDGANTYFQGLVADGAKSALYAVVRASWMEPESPLFGARPVLFVHDEIILEIEEERASLAADELARLMREEIKPCLPDLPIEVEAWCGRTWRKYDPLILDGVHVIQD
jgi:DNA polymerase-1